jgi:sporulation protein YlmC with PRC-barrel domain
VALPEQLLLSDLLRRRVRCDQGLDNGAGLVVWMHPPVHRVLGWVSKPSAFGSRRLAWRLNQLRGLVELEALVKGEPAETEQATVERLPTLMEASLINAQGDPIGLVADAAFEPTTGRIRHYLVSRSDPRLPGSSRWRLTPDRITDQQPGQVFTAVEVLDDLPLARASVRQDLLRRSRRWRDQMQQAGGRFEQRLEGWLEEAPWQASSEPFEDTPPQERRFHSWPDRQPERPWRTPDESGAEPWDGSWSEQDRAATGPQPRRESNRPGRADRDDPWV